MHFRMVPLFLSLFLLTRAIDLSSDLNLPPLSESVYIFVVESDAPFTQIKGSFNVTGGLRHSFRVIGENTFYFVMAGNDTTALRQLTFADGSNVTQYPAAHLDEYYKMFGVDNGFEENDTEDALPDTVLTYVEWDYNFPKGTPVKLFNLIKSVSGMGRAHKKAHNEVKPLMFYPIAYYPAKLIAFIHIEDNAFQHVMKDLQDLVGGIGIIITKTKRIVKM